MRCPLAGDGRQLLDAELALGEAPLEDADLLRELASALVLDLDGVGHLAELLDAVLVVVAVDAERLDLLVEELEHLPVLPA